MRRRARITPQCNDGRFFLSVRVGTINSNTKFADPVNALVDTGARVSVISPGLLDSFINSGIDPRLSGEEDGNRSRVGRIESQGVTFGTKIYQMRVGVELKGRAVLLPDDFLSIHVPDTVIQSSGIVVAYRDSFGDGLSYVILGQDALRVFRARLTVRYRPKPEAESRQPDDGNHSYKVVCKSCDDASRSCKIARGLTLSGKRRTI